MPRFLTDQTIRKVLLPYDDLDLEGSSDRRLHLPDDIAPTLAILVAQSPNGPKLVRVNSDGTIASAGGGGVADQGVHIASGAGSDYAHPVLVGLSDGAALLGTVGNKLNVLATAAAYGNPSAIATNPIPYGNHLGAYTSATLGVSQYKRIAFTLSIGQLDGSTQSLNVYLDTHENQSGFDYWTNVGQIGPANITAPDISSPSSQTQQSAYRAVFDGPFQTLRVRAICAGSVSHAYYSVEMIGQ